MRFLEVCLRFYVQARHGEPPYTIRRLFPHNIVWRGSGIFRSCSTISHVRFPLASIGYSTHSPACVC